MGVECISLHKALGDQRTQEGIGLVQTFFPAGGSATSHLGTSCEVVSPGPPSISSTASGF